MIITNVRKKSVAKQGFKFTRLKGAGEYSIVHLFDPAAVLIGDAYVGTKENAVFIYSPTSKQSVSCESNAVEFEKITFSGDDAAELLLAYGLECDKVYYPSCCEELHDLFNKADDEFFTPRKYAGNAVNVYFEQILISLSRDVNAEEPYDFDEDIVNAFCDIRKNIFDNPHLDWTVDAMSATVDMNKARFFEVYKKLFNTSPIQDIISIRIKIAKTLLCTHRYSVSEVAEMTGYQNVFHFIRQFKKHTNITPKQYEKQN